jgi:hypothetical protein
VGPAGACGGVPLSVRERAAALVAAAGATSTTEATDATAAGVALDGDGEAASQVRARARVGHSDCGLKAVSSMYTPWGFHVLLRDL